MQGHVRTVPSPTGQACHHGVGQVPATAPTPGVQLPAGRRRQESATPSSADKQVGRAAPLRPGGRNGRKRSERAPARRPSATAPNRAPAGNSSLGNCTTVRFSDTPRKAEKPARHRDRKSSERAAQGEARSPSRSGTHTSLAGAGFGCVGASRRLGSYLLDFSGGRRLDGSAVVSEWIAVMRRHQTTLG